MKTFNHQEPVAIQTLMCLVFFYFQLWHIPLTWVVGLMMGAVMPSVLYAFAAQHMLNVIGVYLVHWQSKIFLKDTIQSSTKLNEHLKSIDEKMTEMGSESTIMAMVSLRLFPGSPNAIYNYVFPHMKSVTLTQNIVGCFIGQAPYNYCVAFAGSLL